ncbi:MAG: AAA family ATPase, partial [Chloroflexi bacterium]|nr:AAA family ATPase [Chloroflexota bacterium]
MSALIESSFLCQKLIGRQAYLGQFERILHAASQGSGAVVAISGEPGVGKSRLAAELRALAEAFDPAFDTVVGSCFEFDTSTPYAPLLDMLRGCLQTRAPEQVRACAAPDGPELLRILPELGALLPGVEPSSPRDTEQDKRLLFAALAGTFARFAQHAPLLMVIEDVHWSDDASIEFLTQFSRRAATNRIVILLTFRADDAQPSLKRLLAGLNRERVGHEWTLTHLTTAEISDMVRAIFNLERPPTDEALDQVQSLTDGNP